MYHVLLINNHRQDVVTHLAGARKFCCKANAAVALAPAPAHMAVPMITYQQVRLSTKYSCRQPNEYLNFNVRQNEWLYAIGYHLTY